MGRKRRSVIWLLEREKFVELFEKYHNIGEVLGYFGMANKGGNFRTLRERMEFENIDYDKFKRRKSIATFKTRNDNSIFVENSNYRNRGELKKKMVLYYGVPYNCSKCGLGNLWQDEKIVLVLDHINGISHDNRLENLRFLCPNCNSQTDTFAGRNLKYPIKQCNIIKDVELKRVVSNNHKELALNFIVKKTKTCLCGQKINRNSLCCKFCNGKKPKFASRKVIRPSKEDLNKMVWEKPSTLIAKQYGVSDTMICKWCKYYDIKKPNRGYWEKLYHKK